MGHNPHTSHKNPHSVDDYVFRNTKQRGEGEGVRGCVGLSVTTSSLGGSRRGGQRVRYG